MPPTFVLQIARGSLAESLNAEMTARAQAQTLPSIQAKKIEKAFTQTPESFPAKLVPFLPQSSSKTFKSSKYGMHRYDAESSRMREPRNYDAKMRHGSLTTQVQNLRSEVAEVMDFILDKLSSDGDDMLPWIAPNENHASASEVLLLAFAVMLELAGSQKAICEFCSGTHANYEFTRNGDDGEDDYRAREDHRSKPPNMFASAKLKAAVTLHPVSQRDAALLDQNRLRVISSALFRHGGFGRVAFPPGPNALRIYLQRLNSGYFSSVPVRTSSDNYKVSWARTEGVSRRAGRLLGAATRVGELIAMHRDSLWKLLCNCDTTNGEIIRKA
jgi:hypothetical protein